MKISFKVCGKPPKKSSGKSIWTHEHISEQVFELRTSAVREKKRIEMRYPLRGSLKIELIIHSPRTILEKEDTHNYVGDLDSFVAGVCDSLRSADKNVDPHKRFQKDKEIDPSKHLIIEDDSNITQIVASKVKDNEEYYMVKVEDIDQNSNLHSRILRWFKN